MDTPFSPQADRRAAVVQWRPFLRALADEIDTLSSPADRDALLRNIGRRMALLMPLPPVASLVALELEMNETLAGVGWGQVSLQFHEADRALAITHEALPQIGSAGTPPGSWLAALLEGLYETWFAQQPGAEPNMVARLMPMQGGAPVVLRFGRG